MKFGVREICNVVFRAKANTKIGNQEFKKGQPVLYIDTAKTSTMEGAATTVYAQGGRGNTRLLAWEGEKTLTFTVEDAMLSPIGFSVLSGAGLIKAQDENSKVHVHSTSTLEFTKISTVDATKLVAKVPDTICKTAPIFVMEIEGDGSLTGKVRVAEPIDKGISGKPSMYLGVTPEGEETAFTAFVDYYVVAAGNAISEIQIDAEKFGGYYYVEADTLFKRQIDGVDMPANITFPNVKIQSNFTFSMASTGDPSTFTFTMDAFPGYTYFDQTKKVLCVIQVVEDAGAISEAEGKSVMTHVDSESIKAYEKGDTKPEGYGDSQYGYDDSVNPKG